MKATAIDQHCHRDRDGIVFTLERRALHMRRRRARPRRLPVASGAHTMVAPLQIDLPRVVPRVLVVSADPATLLVMQVLLAPEVFVNHAATLAEAREALAASPYSLAVIDPAQIDGDAAELLPALRTAQLLVYSDSEPEWRLQRRQYLCRSEASPRQLWSTLHRMLQIGGGLVAGD